MAIITLNNNSLSSVTALPASIPTGKILQTVNSTTNYGQSTTGTTAIDVESSSGTAWETSITPSSTSSKILAIATLFEVTFGIPYWLCVIIFTIVVGLYIIVGGLYAVMWTHAIQGLLMLVGMLILTFGIYSMLGGIGPAHESASILTIQDLTRMGWINVPDGFTTLTSFPELFSAPPVT